MASETDDDPLADESARGLLAALAAAPPIPLTSIHAPAFAPGDTIGELRIEEQIGQGGMGVVYRAHEPELDRAVALKLQRFDDRDGSGARLREEARAMAKVVHPNVVTVHAVGVERGVLYIAMELVTGGTLGEWLASPRSPRDVVAMFLQAGAGIAAAHRSGLVHRDFKPDNVLLDAEGRPKVADFGLARATTGTALGGTGNNEVTLPQAGTRAYMAPEQSLGTGADAPVDQFAFCVALYEALSGTRPFPDDLPPRLLAIESGTIARRPEITRPVFAVLRRGLAAAPEDRFASMGDLLVALERAHNAPMRRLRLAVLGSVLAGAGLLAVLWPPTQTRCSDPDTALGNVWSDERHEQVHAAALDGPWDEPGWLPIERELDDFADAWKTTWGQACPTDPKGPAVACLRRSAAAMDTIVGAIERTGDARGGALQAIAKLQPPEQCRSPLPVEHDSEIAEALEQLEARRMIEPGDDLVAPAQELLAQAKAADLPWEVARADLLLAQLCGSSNDACMAEAERALASAISGGDRQMVIDAMAYAIQLHSQRREYPEASTYDRVFASIEIDDLNPSVRGVHSKTRAGLMWRLDQHDEAVELARDGLDAWRRAEGDEAFQTLMAWEDLAFDLALAQRWTESRAEYEALLPLLRKRYGPLHFRTGRAAANLAAACARLGDHDCAKTALAEGMRVMDATPDAGGHVVGGMLIVAQELGDYETAEKLAWGVIKRDEKEFGPDDIETHKARHNLATMLGDAHRPAEAEAIERPVYEAFKRPDLAGSAWRPRVGTLLAGLLRDQGRAEEAIPLHEESIALAVGRDHSDGDLMNLRVEYAHTLLAADRPAEALAQAELALSELERLGVRKAARAEIGFAIARALGQQSPRAVQEARAAEQAYGTMGPRYADELARVQQWLKTTSSPESQGPSPPETPNAP